MKPATTKPDAMDLELELNDQAVRVTCPPDTRLLTLLSEYWHLTGAKPGCEVGRCGACMVWLDGEPANACLLMAWQLQGRHVHTIESVAGSPECAPVQEALAVCGGVQCGYCTSGLLMSMTWLHQQTPRPNVTEAVEHLSGNLCRCTGYGGILRAATLLFPTP